MLRNPAAAVAAVVVGPLVRRMGSGWCFSGLALLDAVAVSGILVLIVVRAGRWRVQEERKKVAHGEDTKGAGKR